MYEVEATQGYILSYYNASEADRRYRVLTPDMGVIFAQATSVRKEASKLKHFLQKLNLVDVEVISSKSGYRITGGRLVENTSRQLDSTALSALDRVGELIGRLSQGSDEHTVLFSIFTDTISQLSTWSTKSDIVELWATARVLVEYGYFDPSFSDTLQPELFTQTELSEEGIVVLQDQDKQLERYIKQCITETML